MLWGKGWGLVSGIDRHWCPDAPPDGRVAAWMLAVGRGLDTRSSSYRPRGQAHGQCSKGTVGVSGPQRTKDRASLLWPWVHAQLSLWGAEGGPSATNFGGLFNPGE